MRQAEARGRQPRRGVGLDQQAGPAQRQFDPRQHPATQNSGSSATDVAWPDNSTDRLTRPPKV